MGLWGASQAVAFGLGGFLGTVAVDAVNAFAASPAAAYATVFSVEALLFCWASLLALRGRSFAGDTGSNLRTPMVSPT